MPKFASLAKYSFYLVFGQNVQPTLVNLSLSNVDNSLTPFNVFFKTNLLIPDAMGTQGPLVDPEPLVNDWLVGDAPVPGGCHPKVGFRLENY